MLIDFIVLIIFGYFMMIGFRRGFWLSTLHSTSTIVSLWIASQFYVAIAQRLIVFLPFPKTVAYDTNYAIQYDYLQLRFEKIIGFLVIAIICKSTTPSGLAAGLSILLTTTTGFKFCSKAFLSTNRV